MLPESSSAPFARGTGGYRDSRALYFRYGQFVDTHTVDVLGRHRPHILGPDGPVADDRRLGYAQPWWQPWPFSDWKPAGQAGEVNGSGQGVK